MTPVVAEVVRGGLVESRHCGSVLGIDSAGQRVIEVGDVDVPMYPRSSVKPLQALGMLATGWRPDDDRFIALACASHSGEPAHVDVVRRILAAAGLDETALDNTPDLPLGTAAAQALIRAGGGPDRVHQNCSGKHAAMLATCVANGWPTATYRSPEHPLQVAIRRTIEDFAGEGVAGVSVDGCGAPLFALSLAGLAAAFRRLVAAPPTDPAGQVAATMRAHPSLVGGTGRDVTELMTRIPGLVAKDGAEGVYAAALGDGRVVALKIDDGSSRARVPVLVAALARLGVAADGLEQLAAMPVLGHGAPVGEVRAVLSRPRGAAR